MNQTMKGILWIVGVVVVVGGVHAFVSDWASESKDVIKFGFIAPLTGEAAPYGEPVRDAVEIAVEEINKAGGIKGRILEVIYEDGKCNGKDAASAAQKLVSIDKVKVIIGGICSSEVLAEAPITEQTGVVLFGFGSNPQIADAGKYIFRNWPNDNEAGKVMAQEMFKSFKKAGIISEQTEYAQGLRDVFVKEFESLGGTVSYNESYLSDARDFRSLISKMKAVSPDALFINSQTGGAAARIARQIREMKMNQQFYVAYITGPDYTEVGSAVEGTIVVDAPILNPANEKAARFLDAYQNRFGKKPNHYFAAGIGYDAIHLLSQAIAKFGENTDKISKYLYELPLYSGIIGDYRFDEKGDVVGINLVISKVEKGELVPMY